MLLSKMRLLSHRLWLTSGVIWVVLGGSCQPDKPAAEHSAARQPPASPTTADTAKPRAPSPGDTIDYLAARLPARPPADTTLIINGQRYQLSLRATADSSRMLQAKTSGIVGNAFAVDTNFVHNQLVQGPEGRYSIMLRDATGRRVFRREFRKADFYPLVGADIAVVAAPEPPIFLGYYPALGGLAFWQSVAIPRSDVGMYVFLLVDLRGRVREISYANTAGYGCADCVPQAAAAGRALLTCAKLLRPDQSPLPLPRPKAELVLARFINDTTLLTIYDYAQFRYTYEADSTLASMTEEEPAAMRHVPNAFLTTVRGTELASFRYNGAQNILGYLVPRAYVPACDTYYLLDEDRGLRLINKRNPAATREVTFRHMRRFTPPQRPDEVRFRVQSETASFDFYASRLHPEQLRYQSAAAE